MARADCSAVRTRVQWAVGWLHQSARSDDTARMLTRSNQSVGGLPYHQTPGASVAKMRGLRASRLSTVAEKLCRPASYSGSVDGLLTRAVARHGNQRDERAAFECAPKIQPPAGIRGRPPIGRPATVPGARPFSTGDAAAQHPRHARSAVSMDTLGAGTWPSAARGLPSVILRLGRGTPAVCANRHSGAWCLDGGGGGDTVGKDGT